MKLYNKYLLLWLLLISQHIYSQVKFEAQVSRNSIGLNENLRVDFTMNGDGDNFQPPRLDGFQVVGGPNQSVSYLWTNGEKSFTKTYSYFLAPTQKGKLTIGSASITIENKVYKTEPLVITVSDAIKQDDPDSRLTQSQQQMLKGIHVVTEVSKSNPYINEPITITHKLYVSHNSSIRNYIETSSPKYNKFWSNPVDLKDQKVEQGKYNGEDYRYVVLRKLVVMPQESGELEIEPMVLEIEAAIPTGRRDFFGYPEIGFVSKSFSSGTRKIKVKALPEKGKPENFSGAVGKFNFKVSPSVTSLKAGEPIQLKVEVEGRGNLNLFSLPQPEVPSALELYDPVSSENVQPGQNGLQGNKTDQYTIIPQYKGEYKIKPLSFSYFDLEQLTYKTIQSDEIALHILEGPTLPTNAETNQSQLAAARADFQPNQMPKTIAGETRDFLGSTWFYILLIAPLLAMPLVVFLASKKRQRDGDHQANKLKKSNKLIKKYLGEAKRNLGNKALFYEALERCLHNFLKAKLNIETSEMSNENIEELLEEKAISPSNIQQFMDLKNACEFARYTPNDQVNMPSDMDRAVEILSELDKQFK